MNAKDMTIEELEERYADAYIQLELMRLVLNGRPLLEEVASKQLLGKMMVEFMAIQIEIQRRLIGAEPASPWRTGEPEFEGRYLVDIGEEYGDEQYVMKNYDPDGWGWKQNCCNVLRWMEIPGEEYGERCE